MRNKAMTPYQLPVFMVMLLVGMTLAYAGIIYNINSLILMIFTFIIIIASLWFLSKKDTEYWLNKVRG